MYWLNAFRQIRNPDATETLWPSQAEFFTSYQGIGPDFTWPDAPAGEYEGINVNSLAGGYVFGNTVGNFYDEATRLSIDGVPVETVGSASAAWELGKKQRGAADPMTGAVGSPAFAASVSYSSQTRGQFSNSGNSYGGFFPIPDAAGATCADGAESLVIKFTKISDSTVVNYPGSCVENASDAAAVYRMPLGYYVVKGSGSVDYYPRSLYIEGPYTRGEHPMHTWGDHLPRVMSQFAAEFRGTSAQRQDELAGKAWLGDAFDIAHFLTRPYYLAPAIGTTVGSDIFAQYPSGRIDNTFPTFPSPSITFYNFVATGQVVEVWNHPTAGTYLGGGSLAQGEHLTVSGLTLGGNYYVAYYPYPGFRTLVVASGSIVKSVNATGGGLADYSPPASNASIAPGTRIGGAIKTHDGFCIAAALVECSGIYGDAKVTFRNGDTVIGTATVSATTTSAICTFESAQIGSNITATLDDGARFSAAGSIRVEWAELLTMKPGLNDLFVVLRLAGCKSSDALGADGGGISEDQALALWESYKTNGCVALTEGHSEMESSTSIGGNAFYDTMRRMSKVVRMVPRQNLLGYAVEDGNSVVWLSPDYVAVPRSANTSILEGITDAIEHTAPPLGVTNEWCAFVNVHPYHVSESSIWKASSFTDYWPIIDRCQFYTGTGIGADREFKRFITWSGATAGGNLDANIDLTIYPEAPSGYRYAKNANQSPTDSFFKSCRIYEPPLAVTSAESQSDGSVKVTFKGRFHHHADAPASLTRDVDTWDIVALTAEADDYRTEENALREYLVHARGSGSYQCSNIGAGNSQHQMQVNALPDNPFGTCYPTIFLVQLLPKPYLDGNDKQGPNDTPFESGSLRQAELYLRCMAEGFVDKQTTESSGCAATATYDFRYEQLCYQATGHPYLLPIGNVESKYLDATEVRTDSPEGFGPMPTTKASSSVFNGFANATNLLNRVRVALPWELKVDTSATSNTTTTATGAAMSDGTPLDCSTYSGGGFLWRGAQPDLVAGALPGAFAVQPYATSELDTVVSNTGPAYTCDGSNFQLYTTRYDAAYLFSPVDADALDAIPDEWRAQLQTDAEFVATQETVRRKVSWTEVAPGGGEICDATEGWTTGGGNVLAVSYTDESEVECVQLVSAGTVSAPAQRTINLAASQSGGTVCYGGGGYSSGHVARTLTPMDATTLVLPVPLVAGDPAT